MEDYIDILRRALQDPELKGFKCLRKSESESIQKALSKYPKLEFVSEWKYELGRIKYKYYVHSGENGNSLEKLVAEGRTSRHPRLIRVYRIKEIREMLSEPVTSGSH